MRNLIARFVKDESGATAIEYGLIAAGISLAIIVIIQTLGGTLNTKFTAINTALTAMKYATVPAGNKGLGDPGPFLFRFRLLQP
jgi:pilus assembly protein Flp/PilA